MNRSALALGLALVGAMAFWASAGLPLRSSGGELPIQEDEIGRVSPDVFSAQVEAREYVRNPDGTARIVFTNCGNPVHVTICGSKNVQEAATRFADIGPLEVRAGEDNGLKTVVLGSVPRNQPFFALRFAVPGGTPEKPMNVFLWNGDRDKQASLTWRLIVSSSP